ncbi:MAG: hypothetical protein WC708_11745 [Lentisphaeria bacterium]
MNINEAYIESLLLQKAWETALPVVDRRGETKDDLSTIQKTFVRRKSCAGLDTKRCIAALNVALAVAKEMRRYQFSHMGSSTPEVVRKYEHLFTLAKRLRDTLPDAPDILIDLACGTIQGEWMR